MGKKLILNWRIYYDGYFLTDQLVYMALFYFKRNWDETTGDPLTNSWGTSVYYFETNAEGEVFRQIAIYQNGKKLRYDQNHIEDAYGGLSDVLLDVLEFEGFKIDKDEFEQEWAL